MTQVIDQAVRPRFTDSVRLSVDSGQVSIADGTYRASVRAEGVTLADVERIAAGLAPAELLDEVTGWFGGDETAARALVDRLFGAGLLIDPSAGGLDLVPGRYVACRLLDVFRRSFPGAVADAPLLRRLAAQPHPGLALGFLVETYFVVRAATWTAGPVFGHDLTPTQRDALEDFRSSESGHGELLLGGFAEAGLDPAALRRAIEAVETMAYSHAYGAFALQGVPEFAAALILPEVPVGAKNPGGDGPAGAEPTDVLDLLAGTHGVPDEVIRRFRLHDDDDVEGDHAGLPQLLLAQERGLGPDRVTHLFAVLRQMIDLYRGHLDGVYRRYERWAPSGDSVTLPDNAYRHVATSSARL